MHTGHDVSEFWELHNKTSTKCLVVDLASYHSWVSPIVSSKRPRESSVASRPPSDGVSLSDLCVCHWILVKVHLPANFLLFACVFFLTCCIFNIMRRIFPFCLANWLDLKVLLLLNLGIFTLADKWVCYNLCIAHERNSINWVYFDYLWKCLYQK